MIFLFIFILLAAGQPLAAIALLLIYVVAGD